MRKVIEEGLRSIQSTRIDTVMGDPTPIRPIAVLPINPITRPKVEDPEYQPDSVSELAASLSALARLVPPEMVREIYGTIRDIIDRIAPVTHTSLDAISALREGRSLSNDEKTRTAADLKESVAEILDALQDKMRHYRTLGTKYGDKRVYELDRFIERLISIFSQLEKIEEEPKSSQREEKRAALLTKYFSFLKDYNSEIASLSSMESSVEARPDQSPTLKRAIAQGAKLTDENRQEIGEAFRHRIRDLRSAGDTFDAAVARAVEARLRAVETLLSKSDKITDEIYNEITRDPGDLSSFRMGVTAARTGEYDFDLTPLFSPGSIRSVPAGDKPVTYSQDGGPVPISFESKDGDMGRTLKNMKQIASSQYVRVYRRYLQMFDGTEIELQPDVRIDFDRIKSDFVGHAAADLSMQGVARPDSTAREFYEQNKIYIIKDALHPRRGAREQALVSVRKTWKDRQSDKTRTLTRHFTPEAAGLYLANQKIDDFRDIIEKAAIEDESAIKQRAKKEALRLVDKNMSEEEIYRSLSALNLSLKEDEIRRISRSVTVGMGSKRDEQEVISADLTRKIRDALTKKVEIKAESGTVSVSAGDAAKSVLQLVADAEKSFRALAASDRDVLKRRSVTSLAIGQMFSQVSIEEAISDLESASKSASAIAENIDDQKVHDDFIMGLLSVLKQLCEKRRSTVSSLIDQLGNDTSPAADQVRDEVESVIKSLNVVEQAATGLMQRAGRSAAAVVPLYATIARNTSDVDDADDAAMLGTNSVIAQSAISHVAQAVDLAIEEYATKKGGTASDMSARLSPTILRIVADLTQRFPDSQTASQDALTEKAYSAYGLDSRFLPIFMDASDVQADIKELAERKDIKLTPSSVADVIFGASGVSQKIVSSLSSNAPAESRIGVISKVTASMLRAYLAQEAAALGTSRSMKKTMMSLVEIACGAIKNMSSSDSQRKDVSLFLDRIEKILRTGKGAPTIRVMSVLRGSGSARRRVAVDMSEPGTGLFVDLAGVQVIRAVGLPTGSARSSLDFIDPVLRDTFESALKIATADVIERVAASDSHRKEQVRQEVFSYLVEQLKDVAVAVNMEGEVASSAINRMSKILTKSKDSDLKEKVESFQRVIQDKTHSTYSRALATVALNYITQTGRDPGDEVPYFTPVRSRDREDPGTGQKIAKSSYDFVFRGLSLSAIEPTLGSMPMPITDDFMKKVYKIIDLHVLTQIQNVFGNVRQIKYNSDDDKESSIKDADKDSDKESSIKDADKDPSSVMPVYTSSSGVVRSPTNIKKLQVLTLSSQMSERMSLTSNENEGIRGKSVTSLTTEADKLLIKLMLNDSSYLSASARGRSADDNLKITPNNLVKIAQNRRSILSPTANMIIDNVQEYIFELAQKTVGKFMRVEVETEKGEKIEVVMTRADFEARQKLLARGEMLQNVSTEYFKEIGLPSATVIKVDPVSGAIMKPPDPKTFFDERMAETPRIPGQKGYDAIAYTIKSAEVAREYLKVLSSFGMVDAPAGDEKIVRYTKALESLNDQFPDVAKRAHEMTQARTRSTPNVVLPSALKVVTLEGRPHVEGNPTLTVTDTEKHIKSLKQAKSDLLRILGPYQLALDSLNQNKIFERLKETLDRLDSFQRMSKGQGNVIPATPDEDRPTHCLQFFVNLYNECLFILVEGMDITTNKITQSIARDIDNVCTDDISLALNEENERLRSALEDAKKAKSDASSIELQIDQLSKIQAGLSPTSSPSGNDKMKISDLTANTADAMKKLYKNALVSADKARVKVSKAIDRAVSGADREIETLAKHAVDYIKEKTEREVDASALVIVDAVQNLEDLKESLVEEKTRDLTLKPLADDQVKEIDDAVALYVDHILSSKIFGVRYVKPATELN